MTEPTIDLDVAGPEDSLVALLARLAREGFTGDVHLRDGAVQCGACNEPVDSADLEIHGIYRFEGESNPDDEQLVAALTCLRCGWKGVLVSGYGPSMPLEDADLLARLTTRSVGPS